MAGQKFTVIIPTRERSDVLAASIQTVLAQDYENFEIIVSDNFSCDDTQNVVSSFESNKIKYINTGKRVGMTQNWEFALDSVTEGWVTIIGDDDGLLPGSLAKVDDIIRLTGTHAVRGATCSYGWPGLNNAAYGWLGIPLRSRWEKRNSEKWIANVMTGNCSYPNLPVLYNGGFVDFEVLKKIKEMSGTFFRSMAPDVYMGLAIPAIIPDYIYMFEPLAINGASKHSTGTSSTSTKAKSSKSPSETFYSEPNIPFHDALPLDELGQPVNSMQAIIYESYLQSKCLRKSSEFENHQKQLELILASSGQHKRAVVAWGNVFADMHGLDIERAWSKAKGLELKFHIFQRLRQADNGLNSYRIDGNPQYPLKDVYEASVAAAAVRAAAPNRIKNWLRFASRVLHKLKSNG